MPRQTSSCDKGNGIGAIDIEVILLESTAALGIACHKFYLPLDAGTIQGYPKLQRAENFTGLDFCKTDIHVRGNR